jgi:hypothetical protein
MFNEETKNKEIIYMKNNPNKNYAKENMIRSLSYLQKLNFYSKNQNKRVKMSKE